MGDRRSPAAAAIRGVKDFFTRSLLRPENRPLVRRRRLPYQPPLRSSGRLRRGDRTWTPKILQKRYLTPPLSMT